MPPSRSTVILRASLPGWLTWLETLSPTEIDLGLERVQVMLRRLAPTKPDHILLVAGTNGKGSSVAMCDALLRASGVRVGAYMSPHIDLYNERIVVNGVLASDADIVAAFERIEAVRDGVPLTYFEYGTLAAIEVFAAANLDVWVLEVGLGGRLDATNAVTPSASLITNVSLDHCDWLGDDIESISKEKAGVMRTDSPTVFGDRNVPNAISRHAFDIGARLLVAGQDFDTAINDDGSWNWRGNRRNFNQLRLTGLIGEFQIGNAAAVLALLESVKLDVSLSEKLVRDVLATVSLAGRMQRHVLDNREWIFDVAHNPAAAASLAGTLKGNTSPGATICVVGLLDDKDLKGVIEPLRDVVDRWIAVRAESGRATPAEEVARQVTRLCGRSCVVTNSLSNAVDYSRQTTEENDRILITGSFHSVGPALAYLGIDSRNPS